MRKLIFGKKYIQTADLNNSLFINNVAQTVTMNGTVTRTTDHKGGNTAIQFGSGNLVSANNLPASPVWSVAFWMKTSSSAVELIFEHTLTLVNNNIFSSAINTQGPGILSARIYPNTTYNNKGNGIYNDNQWHHIVIIFDRNQSATNEIKIYKNKVLQTLTTYNNGENTGNFISDKIYIGGRGNTYTNPFTGVIEPVKMFNYALTQTEIDNLYNE